ncbi:MAG TPA: glycosyltransferase family 4 protein [Solirubrobacteraceae bacterium]|jgi:glycosyltransferase involved in cell wall biosynthesis|nr:glycosyltransferase family 4 protein [Solirubrobacteraceae bacterium]
MEAIVEACDYHGPYPGNFIPSLLAVGDAVRLRLGLEYVPVFPAQVCGRPWVDLVRSRGYEPHFIPAGGDVRTHARALHDIAASARAKLIRSHFTRFDIAAGIGARRIGARSIWNIHSGLLEYTPMRRLSDVMKVRLLGRVLCDRLIAVSDEIARELRIRGHPAPKVSVVLNGIDVSRFNDLPARAEARAALGLGPEERVALAFCWTPFRKGADLIAAACAREGSIALLVGGDELANFLDPMPNNVRIIPPADDPRVLFAASDVFVSASREEGLPYAIGEAMAARLPIASSRIPGPAPYFDAPGLETFDNEDVDGLATVLDNLLDPVRRPERGEANRMFVEQRLGLDRHVERVLEIFECELGR